jgi:hypothetical protein
MAEYSDMPPEERLPEEIPTPAPSAYPPPEEGVSGNTAGGRSEHSRSGKAARQRAKSALLFAIAGVTLCGVISTAPMKPAATAVPPVETAVTEPTAEPAPTPLPATPPPAETEPPVLTAAERLVAIGTWKNSAENEWVHFNEDGTGWWYDGTFFGCMDWAEDQDGGVRYDAAMAYLGPGRKYSYDWAPETEGDSMHCTDSSGSIALLPNEDRFSCPGLRFGTGSYLPDDMPIDASVMDGVCGKTPSELLSGTSWHMVETSNLGIPIAPSSPDKPGVYTDLVYVQSIDFGSGSFRLSTRDGGLLEQWIDGTTETGAVSPTLDVPFALSAGGKLSASALCEINANCHYVFYSDYSPGNTEYNNMQLLWGHQYGPEPEEIYLFFTGEGPRLGMRFSDWYPDNYTLLALD